MHLDAPDAPDAVKSSWPQGSGEALGSSSEVVVPQSSGEAWEALGAALMHFTVI